VNLRDERYQFLRAAGFVMLVTALICWLITFL